MYNRTCMMIVSLGLLGIITGCGTSNHVSNQASTVNQTEWLTSNPAQKTVNLKWVAGYNHTDSGMNFDGYSNGNMTITVPQGWTVHVSFSNHDMMTHSAMVVPYQLRTDSSFPAKSVSFHGASTPNPSEGTMSGQEQTFTFIASKSGKYAIVCGIPGHASLGMWDTLIVSNSASNASVSVVK